MPTKRRPAQKPRTYVSQRTPAGAKRARSDVRNAATSVRSSWMRTATGLAGSFTEAFAVVKPKLQRSVSGSTAGASKPASAVIESSISPVSLKGTSVRLARTSSVSRSARSSAVRWSARRCASRVKFASAVLQSASLIAERVRFSSVASTSMRKRLSSASREGQTPAMRPRLKLTSSPRTALR